jgi:hypothetical protein
VGCGESFKLRRLQENTFINPFSISAEITTQKTSNKLHIATPIATQYMISRTYNIFFSTFSPTEKHFKPHQPHILNPFCQNNLIKKM